MITRQEEIDGKWYAWVPYDGLNCLMFEDNHEITEEEAQIKLDEWKASQVVEEPDGVTN